MIKKYGNEYIGLRYGRLTIVGFNEIHRFICRCDCGTEKTYVCKDIISGKVVSCGCHAKEIATKHGDSNTNLYKTWSNMKRRCYNKNCHNYNNYGGRGITVCQEWLNDYAIFKEWALSRGYDRGLSIDRINNNGNYEPSNCRWATAKVQNSNKRYRPKGGQNKKRLIWEINGTTKPASEWCNEYGVSMPMVRYRINKNGMTPQEALTQEKKTDGRPKSIGA
jgi:hypothetical protein